MSDTVFPKRECVNFLSPSILIVYSVCHHVSRAISSPGCARELARQVEKKVGSHAKDGTDTFPS